MSWSTGTVTAKGQLPERAAAHVLKGSVSPPRHRSMPLRGRVTEVAVYARSELVEGEIIQGPVMVEERESTIFVLPGRDVYLHASSSLIADKLSKV